MASLKNASLNTTVDDIEAATPFSESGHCMGAYTHVPGYCFQYGAVFSNLGSGGGDSEPTYQEDTRVYPRVPRERNTP